MKLRMSDYMYFFRNMHEESHIFEEGENLLIVPYVTETGRGSFKINMQAAFPVSKSDFRKICGMIRISPEYDAVLEKLTAYIDTVLSFFDEYREGYKGDAKGAAEVATAKKRWLSMREVLEKEFSIAPAEADSSIVKFKKCEVLTMIGKHGQAEIELHSGFCFEKFGRVFHCYQKSRGFWQIIVPQFGLAIGSYANNKNACAETVTENIARQIDAIFDAKPGTEQAEKAASMRADFMAALSDSDFAWIIEGNADYTMPEQPQEATEGAEAAETIEHTAEATERHTEATESTETAEVAETVAEAEETEPDTTGICIAEFIAEYRRQYEILYENDRKRLRTIPAYRAKYRSAMSYFDTVLQNTELCKRYIHAAGDFVSSDREAAAFTLAYYAILERQRTQKTPHGNGLRLHTVAYTGTVTERHREPQNAVLRVSYGILCHAQRNGRKKPQRRHTGKYWLPCLVFRTIPGTVRNCRAIVTDTS